MYRLYTEVKVATRFIEPRAVALGSINRVATFTSVYNILLPCHGNDFQTHFYTALL